MAIGSLLVLGTSLAAFAREHDIAVESLDQLTGNLWTPEECPLCRAHVALEDVAAASSRSHTNG